MTTPSVKNYLANQIQRGACDAWIDLAEPATGSSFITIDAPSGTPDATANPNAKHLGLIDSASMLTYTPKPDLEKVDQDSGIVAIFDGEEEVVIETTLKQTAFNNVLQYCMPGTTFSDGTKEGLSLGRGANIIRTPQSLALIGPSVDPNFKWVVALLYKAVPVGPITVEISRTKTALYKVKFQGLSDLTRNPGDRIGSIYKTN